MDCLSVNVYKEEEILSPFLYTTHLYFLIIRTCSMFTLSCKKILQVYCLDSVSSDFACGVGKIDLQGPLPLVQSAVRAMDITARVT